VTDTATVMLFPARRGAGFRDHPEALGGTAGEHDHLGKTMLG